MGTGLATTYAIDPALRSSYRRCRDLHRAYGRSYYLATRLLPREKRPFVHALYGFARYADEIVDDLASPLAPREKQERLDAFADAFLREARLGASRDPVRAAVVDTIRRFDIDVALFESFLASMRMDLTVDRYETYADLARYMEGSAAAIGLMMLPILEPVTAEAEEPAAHLGVAFQLTNFVRDVGEDLRRGRVYLPLEDLARFGVTPADLGAGAPSDRVRNLVAFEVARTRAVYDAAAPGISLLHPSSRPCIRAAYALYGAILQEVERADYDVLTQRVRVGHVERLRLVAAAIRDPGRVSSLRLAATSEA